MPGMVENFVERNEGSEVAEALENGRNTVSITTCDTLDRDHIETNLAGYTTYFTHRRILAFVVLE